MFMWSNSTGHVTIVCQPKILLYLAMFYNGRLKQDSRGNIKFSCYRNSQDLKQMGFETTKRILVIETSILQYTGSNFENWVTQKTKMHQYFVGVQSMKTGIMALCPADIFDCKSYIQCTSNSIKILESSSEKANHLAQAFGSKRKKKSVESRMKDGGIQDAFMPEVEDIKKQAVMFQKETNVESQSNSVIPPRYINASSPEEVYNLCDIISEQELEDLHSKGVSFQTATLADIKNWKINSKFCAFVINHLEMYLNQLSLYKAKLLYYFNYLVALLRLDYKDLKQRDPLHFISQPFKNNLLDKFFAGGSDAYEKHNRIITPQMKDKIMIHAMVIALFIDNFMVDAHKLQQDFKVSMSKITKLAYALGCHVNKKRYDAACIIQLKLPLYNHTGDLWKKKSRG